MGAIALTGALWLYLSSIVESTDIDTHDLTHFHQLSTPVLLLALPRAIAHYCLRNPLGQGSSVLLLPAFSTVSSRTELAGIAQILSPHFQVITLDWLGFGESDRPRVQYDRALYQQLLQDFVQQCCPQPLAIVAAGHAAGYAMHLAQHQPSCCSSLWHKANRLAQVLQGAPAGFSCLAWNPHEGAIAAGGSRGELLVWTEARKGKRFG